jgi:hypothetical protein
MKGFIEKKEILSIVTTEFPESGRPSIQLFRLSYTEKRFFNRDPAPATLFQNAQY